MRVTDGRILTYYSFSVSKYVCVFSLFSRVIFSCSDFIYIFWHYVLYRVVWSPSYALLVSRLVCGIFSNYYHKSFEFPLKWYFFLVGTCKTPTKNQGHSGISEILSVPEIAYPWSRNGVFYSNNTTKSGRTGWDFPLIFVRVNNAIKFIFSTFTPAYQAQRPNGKISNFDTFIPVCTKMNNRPKYVRP